MKKVFIILALAVFGFANAQKGTILVAGGIEANFNKSDNASVENKGTTVIFMPKVGYQATEHWTFGVDVRVSGSNNESTNFNGGGILQTNTTKSTSFYAGPFVRYTKPLTDIFSVYADMGFGFNSDKTTLENGNGFITNSSVTKGDGFSVGAKPAVFINIKKNFGLNFAIGGISYGNPDSANGTQHNSGFDVSFGRTFSIGVSKNF
jgi:hypothetical protein